MTSRNQRAETALLCHGVLMADRPTLHQGLGSDSSYQHCWGLAYIVPLPEDRDPQAYSELLPWEKAAISGLRPSPRASVI